MIKYTLPSATFVQAKDKCVLLKPPAVSNSYKINFQRAHSNTNKSRIFMKKGAKTTTILIQRILLYKQHLCWLFEFQAEIPLKSCSYAM